MDRFNRHARFIFVRLRRIFRDKTVYASSSLSYLFIYFFLQALKHFYSTQFYVTWPTTYHPPLRQFSFSYSKYVWKHICSLRVTNDLYWCAPLFHHRLAVPKISCNVISQSNELLPKRRTAKIPIKSFSSFVQGKFWTLHQIDVTT